MNTVPASQHESSDSRIGEASRVEKNNTLILGIAPDGRIGSVSPPRQNCLGYDAAEMKERLVWSFAHREDLPAVFAFFREVKQRGYAQGEREFRVRHKDGSWRWHAATGISTRVSRTDGDSIIIVSRDITARKRLEESVLHDRILLRTVLDVVPSMICVRSLEGRYLLVNKPLAEFLGQNVTSMTGRRAEEITMNETILSEYRAFDREIIDNGKRKYIPETLVKDHRGATRVVETLMVPLVVNGEPGVLIVSRDNTEHLRADRERRELIEKLNHADRVGRGGEIAVSLAHELNQPLTGILSNAQAAQLMLAREKPDLAEIGNILADIVEDDKRAGRVIQRLRGFLKRQSPFWDLIDINETVREILKLIRPDAALKDVEVTLELADGLPKLFADRIQVQQVLLNLVVNAEEAMADQSPTDRRVTIETSRGEAGEVIVSVRDTGPGIARKDLPRLFDMFAGTTKPDGMGVGLAICRSIVQAHGGRIWAANNPDRGATLSFTLPEQKKTGLHASKGATS